MPKKNKYICIECQFISLKWLGKCPECSSWNSLQEEDKALISDNQLKKINFEVKTNNYYQTGTSGIDRVMGGGIRHHSINLIGGEPGIGKSTLLLSICNDFLKKYKRKTIYISGEESSDQINDRFLRMNLKSNDLKLLSETSWSKIKKVIEKEEPEFIILDSIQTILIEDISSMPGSLNQVREIIYDLMRLAKTKGITCFVIGHITKDGQVAGPKTLEHMVDGVFSLEGSPQRDYRIFRCLKNRFGKTNESSLFEMSEKGLIEVNSPETYFLNEVNSKAIGRSIAYIEKGKRNYFLEIQALVTKNTQSSVKRVLEGIDQNRLNLLIAIIEKFLNIGFNHHDIYMNVSKGVKIKSPQADLAIICALLSSLFSKNISSRSLFVGEINLNGELIRNQLSSDHIEEINRLNFNKVFLSQDQREYLINDHYHEIKNLKEFWGYLSTQWNLT